MSTSRVGHVTLSGRTLTHERDQFDVADAHASIETDGEVVARFTATRILALGVFALAFKKKKDNRGLYLMVEGPDYAFVAELDPKKDALSGRQMAAAITTAGKKYSGSVSAPGQVAPTGGGVPPLAQPPVQPLAAPMHVDGYMSEIDWDGVTLRVHGTTKVSRIALNGPDHGGDVELAAGDIVSVALKPASAMVNGHLTVDAASGRTYQLHFRRKSQDEFARLHESLSGVQPAIAPAGPDPELKASQPPVSTTEPDPVPLSVPTPAPTVAAPLTPAGWHPDPHQVARLRYWDGTTWTEHTAE